MSVQARQLPATLHSSTTNDCDLWRDYWRKQKQPWRTEPEIEVQRQAELVQYSHTLADSEQGHYPFKDTKLTRADIEWLLAAHEDERPFMNEKDQEPGTQEELDLRGANLRKMRLSGLPLKNVRGGLPQEDRKSTRLNSSHSQISYAVFCLKKNIK